jgi:hypothetical protein
MTGVIYSPVMGEDDRAIVNWTLQEAGSSQADHVYLSHGECRARAERTDLRKGATVSKARNRSRVWPVVRAKTEPM